MKIEPHKQDKQQMKPGSRDAHGHVKSYSQTATYEDLNALNPVYENIVS